MKKYFISSDIHSFYDEWMKALKDNGFDLDNPEHILIVCGDIFDRGTKPLEVYEFLKNLPKERRILIRGNHELLLRDLVIRGYAEQHDKTNGTVDTVFRFLGKGLSERELIKEHYKNNLKILNKYDKDMSILDIYATKEWEDEQDRYGKILFNVYKHNDKVKEVLNWIFSDEWVYYYETKNHVFVHSFIPIDYSKSTFDMYYNPIKTVENFREDWRNATDTEWEDAAWGCPYGRYLSLLYKHYDRLDNKTLVCGHWHTSDFYNNLDFKDDKKHHLTIDTNPIYQSTKYKHLIGLDACTAISGTVNVLVLSEEEI